MIKQSLLLLSLLSGFSLAAQQDTTYWRIGGLNTLNFSQVSLTNWAAGGNNSVAINAFSSTFADYKRARHSWENSLDLAYGLIKQGDLDFIKSDDKINLVSKYGFQMFSGNKQWFFTSLVDFRTQFDEGYSPENPDSLISNFFAPAYVLAGVGFEYRPYQSLSFSYIPISVKFTFVADDELSALGAYGVSPGDHFRGELGSFFRAKYVDEIIQNINVDSRLELFTNYFTDFGNIDVNWQNAITMKVNSLIMVTFLTQLIYDDDIIIEIDENGDGVAEESGPRVQFKSVLGVGFSYQFGAKKEKKTKE